MKTTQRLIVSIAALAALAGGVLLAGPALAKDGPWTPIGVECDVDTGTVTVTGLVGGSGGDTSDSIFMGGRLIMQKTVHSDEFGSGKGAYSVKLHVHNGATVEVVNDDNGASVSGTCLHTLPINFGHGDHYVVLSNDITDDGDATLKFYCIVEGQGQYKGEVTRSEFRSVHRDPDLNLLVKWIPGCAVPIGVYVLTTGEWQVNIGPDVEGKTAVIIFHKVPPVDVYYYDIGPDGRIVGKGPND
jgi:hypothetical protein